MALSRKLVAALGGGAGAAPFRFVAANGLPGNAVFARTGAARFVNAAGQVAVAATGVPRTAHYINGAGPFLLLEYAATNRLPSSNVMVGLTGITVTSAVGTAPDGTTTAQRLAKTDATTPRYADQTATGFIPSASTAYAISRYFKYDGHVTTVSIENASTEWNLSFSAVFDVNANGTITLASNTNCVGAVETLADGWYRVSARFTSGAAPSGTAGRYLVRVTGGSGVTVQTWEGQMEAGRGPSSLIPTTSGALTREADTCYFDVPALTPREGTFYVRGVELGNVADTGATRAVLSVQNAASADPRYFLSNGGGAGFYRATHAPAAQSTSTMAVAPAIGDVVELRGTLSSTGVAQMHQSINAAAEVSATAGTAQAPGAAWSGTRVYLGSLGGAGAVGIFAFSHACFAWGTQDRASMRLLAGV